MSYISQVIGKFMTNLMDAAEDSVVVQITIALIIVCGLFTIAFTIGLYPIICIPLISILLLSRVIYAGVTGK